MIGLVYFATFVTAKMLGYWASDQINMCSITYPIYFLTEDKYFIYTYIYKSKYIKIILFCLPPIFFHEIKSIT
jgi:hypothetical protein